MSDQNAVQFYFIRIWIVECTAINAIIEIA